MLYSSLESLPLSTLSLKTQHCSWLKKMLEVEWTHGGWRDDKVFTIGEKCVSTQVRGFAHRRPVFSSSPLSLRILTVQGQRDGRSLTDDTTTSFLGHFLLRKTFQKLASWPLCDQEILQEPTVVLRKDFAKRSESPPMAAGRLWATSPVPPQQRRRNPSCTPGC